MGFQIRQEQEHRVTVVAAILLYGAQSRNSTALSPDYATVHPVHVVNDQPLIQAGKPLDQRNLLALSASLAGRSRVGQGLLPAEVLSCGVDHVVWWLPPSVQALFFNTDAGSSRVGQRSGQVPLPGLVFAVVSRQLWVFAVKGRRRPSSATRLYTAPFLNVWKDGQVCTGTTPLPDATVVATIKTWEESFFRSNFTHTNHDQVVRFDGGAHAFWTAMLDGQFPRFPTRVLRPRGKQTVGSLISTIEAGAPINA